uniref:RES family NAD+ phosphorylase n=1 Tax=Alcanivorax sp. TaxID=1872427 RepID=UPI00258901AE
SLYRVRIHDPDVSYSSASELGSPPKDKCLYSNRMSPAGISMFYGASDCVTAILEIYKERGKEQRASCGEFVTLRDLKILDLTKLPGIPSLFDEERRRLRSALIFLCGFAADVSTPIHKDGREHIEYVPTQAFAEYIRHIYKDSEGKPIDGIAYRSSKNPDGVNYVLFAENKHCCDKEVESPSGFMTVEPWLVLGFVHVLDPAKVLKEYEDTIRSRVHGLLGGVSW